MTTLCLLLSGCGFSLFEVPGAVGQGAKGPVHAPEPGTWRISGQTFTSNRCGAARPLLPDTLTFETVGDALHVVELDAAVLQVGDDLQIHPAARTIDFRPRYDCVARIDLLLTAPSASNELSLLVQLVAERANQGPAGSPAWTQCAQALAEDPGLASWSPTDACVVKATATGRREAQ